MLATLVEADRVLRRITKDTSMFTIILDGLSPLFLLCMLSLLCFIFISIYLFLRRLQVIKLIQLLLLLLKRQYIVQHIHFLNKLIILLFFI